MIDVRKYQDCVLETGHDWEHVFTQTIDASTVELNYECLNCGHTMQEYDSKQEHDNYIERNRRPRF